MTLLRFCHAQKNAFAFFVALSFRKIAIGLRRLDFRLPVAPCSIDRFVMTFLLGCHAELKLKEGRFPIGRKTLRSGRRGDLIFGGSRKSSWKVTPPVCF